MARLPDDAAKRIREFASSVPDEDVYDDEKGEKGREDDPHVTVLYGLHTSDHDEVRGKLSGFGPIKARLGRVTAFHNPDCVVLKVAVESQDLIRLNGFVKRNFEYTDTHPEYKPHATIAYLRHRKDDPYWYKDDFQESLDMDVVIDGLRFSSADGRNTTFGLGAGREALMARRVSASLIETIHPEEIPTLWFENESGDMYVPDLAHWGQEGYPGGSIPKGFDFQFSAFPNVLRESILKMVRPDEVAACDHPTDYRRVDHGLLPEYEGERCDKCGGSRQRKRGEPWPPWDDHGSVDMGAMNSSWSEELVLALANRKGWKLGQAIMVVAKACERCMNVLAHEVGLDWGYEHGSEEWKRSNTKCDFCCPGSERPRRVAALITFDELRAEGERYWKMLWETDPDEARRVEGLIEQFNAKYNMASRIAMGEKVALEHILNVECGGMRRNLDQNIELYGMGRLSPKYEKALEWFFGTKDKKRMMMESWKMRQVPVMCPDGRVEIVDKRTGDLVEKVARMTSRRGKSAGSSGYWIEGGFKAADWTDGALSIAQKAIKYSGSWMGRDSIKAIILKLKKVDELLPKDSPARGKMEAAMKKSEEFYDKVGVGRWTEVETVRKMQEIFKLLDDLRGSFFVR
jgi:2'-5' RNA ligase